MKHRFTHIVLRLTFDDYLRTKFEINPGKFIEKHKLKLTPSQRKALLSRNNKLIMAEIEKEQSGVPTIPWPVRSLTWPVRP